MRFFVVSVTLLVWLSMGVWMYSQAASTDSITATVSAQTYSVTVSDGSITYGALANSATNSTLALTDTQVVENDGNVSATVNILSTTSEAWDIVPTVGTDEFRHRFATDGAAAEGSWTALTAAYQTALTGFASNATNALDLEVQVPSSTTATSTQNITVTVQATS